MLGFRVQKNPKVKYTSIEKFSRLVTPEKSKQNFISSDIYWLNWEQYQWIESVGALIERWAL